MPPNPRMQPTRRMDAGSRDAAYFTRVGALAAWSGAPALLIATLLHPLEADPNDPRAAFEEYAADSLWVGSHLGQFIGVVLLAVALLALAEAANTNKARTWARVGLLGTAGCVAAAAALQAVDGVARGRSVGSGDRR